MTDYEKIVTKVLLWRLFQEKLVKFEGYNSLKDPEEWFKPRAVCEITPLGKKVLKLI